MWPDLRAAFPAFSPIHYQIPPHALLFPPPTSTWKHILGKFGWLHCSSPFIIRFFRASTLDTLRQQMIRWREKDLKTVNKREQLQNTLKLKFQLLPTKKNPTHPNSQSRCWWRVFLDSVLCWVALVVRSQRSQNKWTASPASPPVSPPVSPPASPPLSPPDPLTFMLGLLLLLPSHTNYRIKWVFKIQPKTRYLCQQKLPKTKQLVLDVVRRLRNILSTTSLLGPTVL